MSHDAETRVVDTTEWDNRFFGEADRLLQFPKGYGDDASNEHILPGILKTGRVYINTLLITIWFLPDAVYPY